MLIWWGKFHGTNTMPRDHPGYTHLVMVLPEGVFVLRAEDGDVWDLGGFMRAVEPSGDGVGVEGVRKGPPRYIHLVVRLAVRRMSWCHLVMALTEVSVEHANGRGCARAVRGQVTLSW